MGSSWNFSRKCLRTRGKLSEEKYFSNVRRKELAFRGQQTKLCFYSQPSIKKRTKTSFTVWAIICLLKALGKLFCRRKKQKRRNFGDFSLFSLFKTELRKFSTRACLFYMWKRLEGRIWNYTNVVCCLLRCQVNVIRNENSEQDLNSIKKNFDRNSKSCSSNTRSIMGSLQNGSHQFSKL